MTYPSIFYHSQTLNGRHYQRRPTGKPDIKRLVHGYADYWISPTPPRVTKQKKLIFSDWSASGWSEEKIHAVILVISALFEDGFDIYLWQDMDVMQLHRDEFKTSVMLPVSRDLMMPTDADRMLKATALKYGFTRDDMVLIDDYLLNHLLSGNDALLPRNLYVSDFSSISHNPSITLKLILELEPKLTTVVLDEFSEVAINSYHFLYEHLPRGMITTRYRSAKLSNVDIDNLFKGIPAKYRDVSLELSDLAELKRLNLKKNTFTMNLQALFAAVPKLEHLSLSECNDLVTHFNVLPGSLPHLKSVDLSHTEISNEKLLSLFLAATNIEELDLSSCSYLGDLTLASNSLPNLRKIKVSNSKLKVCELKTILSAATHLETLEYSSCDFTAHDEVMFEPTSLPHLKGIHFNNSQIKPSDFVLLLEAAQNLTRIKLGSCSYLSTLISPGPRTLLSLIEVDLNNTDISPYSLKDFLLAAPNIETLNLALCWEISLPIELLPRSLMHLHNIDLCESNISSAALQSLLVAAPNIRYLDLDLCTNLEEELTLAPGSLPDLDLIKISGTNLTAASIENLLAAAPKLNRKDILEQISPDVAGVPIFDTNVETASSKKVPFGAALLDANTSVVPDKTHTLSRIFYPLHRSRLPEVNSYRFDVYQTTVINSSPCTLSNAFSLEKEGELGLIDRPIAKSHAEINKEAISGELFYGKQLLSLSNEWQALASLNAQERMLSCEISPHKGSIRLKYSTRDNLYYICGSQPQTVEVGFILNVPEKPALPADLQKVVDYFLSFTAGALELDKSKATHTGNDFLQAIFHQKKGACRHRAFAFKAWLAEKNPHIRVRVVSNDCHAFAEVLVGAEWITCDLGGYPAKLIINENIKPAVRTVEEIDPAALALRKVFQTWDKPTATTEDPMAYFAQCLSPAIKNRLIKCASVKDIDALQFYLGNYCRQTARPVFYVNSPEDLICSEPFISRKDEFTGELKRGPGGPLHDFLTKNPNGIVIVNYVTFRNDDFVRFNTLFDKTRKADGMDVPPETLIIGLINQNSLDVTPGNDFYSRLDVEVCPFSSEKLQEFMPELPTVAPRDETERFVINLYNAQDWEERLLGCWEFNEGVWLYKKGELAAALASGFSIEIQNGLWESRDFCRFWRDAIQSGVINHLGETLVLPKEITIVRSEGYDWAKLTPLIQQLPGLPTESYFILNQETFSNFFSQYQVTADKQLQRIQGYVAAFSEKVCPIYITDALTVDQWAILLTECGKLNVKLAVYCAPDIELPAALSTSGIEKTPALAYLTLLEQGIFSTQVIQSTDESTTVALLEYNLPGSIVLDVSECHDSDLLKKMDVSVINHEREPLRFEFNETQCVVARALEAGQTVILKGKFSKALADELATLLLTRLATTLPGSLILVSNDTSGFNYLTKYTHTVTSEEKQLFLRTRHGEIPPAIATYIDHEPFSKLETRCRFLKVTPGISSDYAWKGLYHLSDKIKDPGELSSIEAMLAYTNAYMETRKDAINMILATEPYVFLAGLSGVGKSAFVTGELCQPTDVLYQGEPALLAWANDTTPGKRKLLFLDEANLSTSDWSAFEGLFNTPPGILINGEYCLLTSEHKVIFAGNPVNYGSERKLAPLFEHHGNTLIFEPFSSKVLFARILYPVFKNTLFENQAIDISRRLLDVYRFLCSCSDTELRISPRELQMMALLTLSHYSRPGATEHVELVAQYFAYHIGKPMVPKDKLEAFERTFQPTLNLAEEALPASPDFLITPSRRPACQLLNEFLTLRELRPLSPDNEAHLYGGLGGIILQGAPGVGKSELVIAALKARGYEEIRDIHEPIASRNPYYHMPVSMSLSEKETLLRKAFNEGAVVIIDEINCSPMMESLLNALLMGRTPEGTRPEHPGFMVIGTQNPVSMAGRRAASTALNRRMTTIEVPPYKTSEMYDILIAAGMESELATCLLEAYQSQADFAELHHLKPAPTFRDLLKSAQQTVNALQEAKKLVDAAVALLIESVRGGSASVASATPVVPGMGGGLGMHGLFSTSAAGIDFDEFPMGHDVFSGTSTLSPKHTPTTSRP